VGPGAEFGAGGIGRRGGMLVFTAVEPSCADKESAGSVGGGGGEGGSGGGEGDSGGAGRRLILGRISRGFSYTRFMLSRCWASEEAEQVERTERERRLQREGAARGTAVLPVG